MQEIQNPIALRYRRMILDAFAALLDKTFDCVQERNLS